MNSIESNFVPYELAVKLKELGFDEPCLKSWGKEYASDQEYVLDKDYCIHNWNEYNKVYSAPLWSQCFDCFRVEHGLESFITPVLDADPSIHQYSFIICSFGMEMDEFSQQLDEGDFNTYESARLACLEKLIELVTDKNK